MFCLRCTGLILPPGKIDMHDRKLCNCEVPVDRDRRADPQEDFLIDVEEKLRKKP